jgi:cyclin-dependent kinase
MKSSRSSSEFFLLTCITPANTSGRLLGTPTEQEWPGVTDKTCFPDFKSSFPKWKRDEHTPLCNSLDDRGLDLLEMMLVYDPAGRISAKQACQHPYFEEGSSAYSGRGLGPTFTAKTTTNGFH